MSVCNEPKLELAPLRKEFPVVLYLVRRLGPSGSLSSNCSPFLS